MKATGARIVGKKNPGPGNYKTRRGPEGAKYTIRAKTLNPCTIYLSLRFSLYSYVPIFVDSYTTQRSVPGPGQYETI